MQKNNTDLGPLTLGDIIDREMLQSLMEEFYKLTKILSAVLDLSGNILVAVGWQDICTKFHRGHPESSKNCLESDTRLSRGVPAGTFRAYRCKNNLWDIVTPIEVGGTHVGNIFMGQFFYEDEVPDIELFRRQARQYGFDEKEYLAALDRVPRLNREAVDAAMRFFAKLAGMISSMSLSSINLSRAIDRQGEALLNLSRSEEESRSILKTALDGFWRADYDGNLLEVNDAYCRMSGYSAGELLTMRISDLEALERAEDTAARIADIKARGAGSFETRHRRRDGTLFDLEISVQDRAAGNGQVVAFLKDITNRKKTELALREKEQEQRLLLENLRVGIVIHGPDTCILDCNQTACELLSLDRDQMLGKTAIDPSWRFIFENGSPMPLDAFPVNLVAASREKVDNYVLGIDAPGKDSVTWVLISAYPVFNADGELRHIMVSFIDITRLKQTAKELRERDEDLKESQRIAHVGSWRMDAATGKVVWSEELYKMYGFDPELPPPPYSEHKKLFTPKSWERLSKALPKTLETGIPYELELETVRKDGTIGWMWVRGEAVAGASGEIVGLRGAAQDISERKRAEIEHIRLVDQLQLAQKQESVGRLAGGVAHDFNNMLGVILGHTEMILNEMDPALPNYTFLEEVKKAGEHSADLTRQLLAFASRQPMAPEVLDLNLTLEGMLKMVRRLIGENIELLWLPGNEVTFINMDPSQVDQVLVNLCVNARDAIEDVGRITIETGIEVFDEDYCKTHDGVVSGEFVVLAVGDDGCGMTPETLNHIFEPFYTTKEFGKGTGLGLATVYGIVKQNNGFINVSSAPGQGTTIRIHLPRHHGSPGLSKKDFSGNPAEPGRAAILLVEDDPAFNRMAALMLERLGYSVVATCNPCEAMGLAEEFSDRLSLILTDVIMPEMNGRDLANKLQVLYPNLKCLFMSGYTADVIAHHGVLDKGMNFIQKPFSVKELALKVEGALKSED